MLVGGSDFDVLMLSRSSDVHLDGRSRHTTDVAADNRPVDDPLTSSERSQ